MGNDLISVKDLILSEEDVKALQKAKAPDKKEYSYRVLMESGCDFAVERRETRVCFLRETDPLKADKSLVTIEVDDNGRVLQCKAKCNRNPSEEKWTFILEWEKAKNLVDFTHQIPDEMLEDPF